MADAVNNSESAAANLKQYELHLVFAPESFGLSINGNVANYDCALAMLDMARRFFEDKLREQKAAQSLAVQPGQLLSFARRQ